MSTCTYTLGDHHCKEAACSESKNLLCEKHYWMEQTAIGHKLYEQLLQNNAQLEDKLEKLTNSQPVAEVRSCEWNGGAFTVTSYSPAPLKHGLKLFQTPQRIAWVGLNPIEKIAAVFLYGNEPMKLIEAVESYLQAGNE